MRGETSPIGRRKGLLSLVSLVGENLGIDQETIQGSTAVLIHLSRPVMSQTLKEIGLHHIRRHIAVLAWRRAEFGQVQHFALRSRLISLTLRF